MENVILDTHPYMAFWIDEDHVFNTTDGYCKKYTEELLDSKTTDIKYPMWAGEWALATDVCAFWLNGFNDHRDPYTYTCQWVDCPYSYLPEELAADFDRTADILGPFGGDTTLGAIQKGKCMIDSAYYNDDQMKQLSQCMLDAFDENVDGQFIWAAKNEMKEVKWSYTQAYDAGYLKQVPSFFDMSFGFPNMFQQ